MTCVIDYTNKMKTINDTYLFKALDAFPYDIEETMEALNYALSCNEKNPIALGLMARVHGEILGDYQEAKEYFQEALGYDMHCIKLYPHYLNVLLWNEDYAEAEKLIDFALTVKGTDKAVLHLKKAILYESKFEFKEALKCLKSAKKYTFNGSFMSYLDDEKARIKSKMPKKKKKSKKERKCSKSSKSARKRRN